jgi:hypothetical protein
MDFVLEVCLDLALRLRFGIDVDVIAEQWNLGVGFLSCDSEDCGHLRVS